MTDAGRTQDEAAQESGAGSRTIKTWLANQPAFRGRIHQLRAEMTARALGKLADSMANAAETLRNLCSNGRSETVRLSAARAIVELGMKLHESVELEQRIAALEGLQNQRKIA